MGPFDLFDAILGPINPINRVLGALSAVAHTNTKKAKKEGVSSVVAEAIGNASGTNLYQFAIPRDGPATLVEVRGLLRRYGIPTFRLLHDHRNFYFSVKRNQARWAEYLLWQRGIQLENPIFDDRNASYPDRHPAGWMPRPWSAKGDGPVGETSDVETNGQQNRNSEKDPLSFEGLFSGVTAFLDGMNAPQGVQRDAKIVQGPPRAGDQAREPKGWLDQLETLIDRWL